MRSPFSERALVMGLTSNPLKGLYSYQDRHSEIVYRQAFTMPSSILDESHHATDGQALPTFAIFTRQDTNHEYKYCGCVSDLYQFIGNETLNQSIRDSLSQAGMIISTENTLLDYKFVRMRNEIIIQSAVNTPIAGDILPVMVVNNSYNGSKTASLAFGIVTYQNNQRLMFSFNLGEMKQVHIVNATTQMSSVISSYMQVFSDNIVEMITSSFQSRLTPEQMLGTLDLIENIGKKKRDEVSRILQEMNVTPTNLPSAWQMFLAIIRYSSFERNLNVKKLLESAAESVLVIPGRMLDVLSRLEENNS